jgi:hypothetical protein
MTEARGCWESSLLAFVACVVSCGVALAHDVHGIPKRELQAADSFEASLLGGGFGHQ